jgi:hypothetical protein
MLLLVKAPLSGLAPCPHRQPVGDSIKPAAERFAFPNRVCSTGQDEKCCLEYILGRLVIEQRSSGYPQDERPVTLHQGGEGSLIAAHGEAFEEVLVRKAVGLLPDRKPAEVAEERG